LCLKDSPSPRPSPRGRGRWEADASGMKKKILTIERTKI
jgi:hypothetical protein